MTTSVEPVRATGSQRSGLLSRVKSWLVPAGVQPRRVRGGLYRGLTLELDLRSRTQLYLGLWERETFAALRRAAARCRWAVDVGAGQGELCIYLLQHSAVEVIYAFEPSTSEREVFARNLQHNGLLPGSRLQICSEFVGGAEGPEFRALDALELPVAERGLIKIDVDGAELDVLASGRRLLTETPVDLVVETHAAELERDCLRFLGELGYTCQVIDTAWWRWLVPEHRPIEHNRWLWGTRNAGC